MSGNKILLVTIMMLVIWSIFMTWVAGNAYNPPGQCKCPAMKCPQVECPVTKAAYYLSAEGGGAMICCDGCALDKDGEMRCRAAKQRVEEE